MKIIYCIYISNDDLGEIQVFADKDGKILASWHLNDASWRGEYMDRLLEKLGYEVKHRAPKTIHKIVLTTLTLADKVT